jgi:hypothetical protein
MYSVIVLEENQVNWSGETIALNPWSVIVSVTLAAISIFLQEKIVLTIKCKKKEIVPLHFIS